MIDDDLVHEPGNVKTHQIFIAMADIVGKIYVRDDALT